MKLPRWFIFLSFVLFTACTSTENVDITDYPSVTSITDLRQYYAIHVDTTGQYESTTVTSYFDGSRELEYTYELLETTEFTPLFYSITISHETSISDAESVFGIQKGTLSVVGNSFDQGTIEIDSLALPGDEHYYALRTYQNEPNGLFFTARFGKSIYTLVMSGLYSEDHDLLKRVILPRLHSHPIDAFEIPKS